MHALACILLGVDLFLPCARILRQPSCSRMSRDATCRATCILRIHASVRARDVYSHGMTNACERRDADGSETHRPTAF